MDAPKPLDAKRGEKSAIAFRRVALPIALLCLTLPSARAEEQPDPTTSKNKAVKFFGRTLQSGAGL